MRAAWYSFLIWLTSFLVSGFFVLPWYYLVLPIAVYIISSQYLRGLCRKQEIFSHGLLVGFIWFLAVLFLDIVQIVGFDLSALYLNATDPRNFLKFPIVILIPVIYSLVLENSLNHRVDVLKFS